MWTVGQHGRAIVGLQHAGWQVDVQQLDFAVPQQESNSPAFATLPNPRVATTAVKDLIQYITQRLLPLGLMSDTDRRWCQGGEQAVFRTPKRSKKPPATRVAIFLADPCSHRPGRGDKVQNAPQTLIPYQLRNYGATQRRLQVDASQSEMAGLGL